jgi:hypothetical protein
VTGDLHDRRPGHALTIDHGRRYVAETAFAFVQRLHAERSGKSLSAA